MFDAEARSAQEVLARHLEHNILGDKFTESSFATESIMHGRLPEPALANRYVESVVSALNEQKGAPRTR